MPNTTYYKTLMTKVLLGEIPYPATDYYVGLLYVNTEVTDANYERLLVAFTNNTTYATNTSVKRFNPAAGTFIFDRVGLFDAKAGGNLLNYHEYGEVQVATGQRVVIGAGDLQFTV